ncbi:MAG UNVERIFIED_CONTAM: hypothetical protein LVR18_35115 [Planctomycetaceae bacterium]
MGTLGKATVLGRVELRMSGIVAALSVDLDADGLRRSRCRLLVGCVPCGKYR